MNMEDAQKTEKMERVRKRDKAKMTENAKKTSQWEKNEKVKRRNNANKVTQTDKCRCCDLDDPLLVNVSAALARQMRDDV